MIIQNVIAHRRLKRKAHECLHHARHVLHMREDLLPEADAQETRETIKRLANCLRNRQWHEMDSQCQNVLQQTDKIKGPKVRNSWVENFEMLVVAIAVAMGLRAYFLQPFKIPTGSMQPTLNGITAVNQSPTWLDRQPFNMVRFIVTGEWYREIRAKASGRLGEPMEHRRDPSIVMFRIGGKLHRIPKDTLLDDHGHLQSEYHPERVVQKGELLWAGKTQRGDHLFVNKVIWNFRKPKRDEVMVFTTDNIPSLEPGTHYIKRMVGLPGEKISIHEPNLVVNGKPVSSYFGIDRVTSARDGYAGYVLAGHLNSERLEWRLDETQYFALGDNTRNSRDSRFWGPVPQENLVGPAVFVYWPITTRWGLIR